MLSPDAPFVCYQIMFLYGFKDRKRRFDIREASYQHTI